PRRRSGTVRTTGPQRLSACDHGILWVTGEVPRVLRGEATVNTIMRRSVRGAAIGLGALALVLGASACGGTDDVAGGDEGGNEPAAEEPAEGQGGEDAEGADAEVEGAEEESAEEESAESAPSEEGDAAEESAEDEGADTAEEPLAQSDLDAATDRFMELVTHLDDGDSEAVCSFFIDPTTGEPLEGETLTECAELGGAELQGLESNALDAVEESGLDVIDNGDGTVSVSMDGREFPMPLVEADDGEWYLLIG